MKSTNLEGRVRLQVDAYAIRLNKEEGAPFRPTIMAVKQPSTVVFGHRAYIFDSFGGVAAEIIYNPTLPEGSAHVYVLAKYGVDIENWGDDAHE